MISCCCLWAMCLQQACSSYTHMKYACVSEVDRQQQPSLPHVLGSACSCSAQHAQQAVAPRLLSDTSTGRGTTREEPTTVISSCTHSCS